MRFVGWSITSDWNDYYADVYSVTRLSSTKWLLCYRDTLVDSAMKIIVICDQAWVEVL